MIEYDVDNNQNYTVEGNKPFDGAGLVDVRIATIWSYELGLDYLPSAFQFRAIPGIKGNLYVFDFDKFAKEFGKDIISDAWGKENKLYIEDGELAINVILTKSQYKFFEYLSFDNWKAEFETERYGYKRTFNISMVSDKFEDIKDKVLLSYQPLQSLNLSLEEIKELCAETIKKIGSISTDVNEFLKYRGLLDSKEDGNGRSRQKTVVPPYYKALIKNPTQLFADKYIQAKVQDDIKKFKENTCKGAVLVPGNYQTLMPDIFALAQWSFGIEPTGLLKADEVYSNYWLKKENPPLFCTGKIKKEFYDKLISENCDAVLQYMYDKIFCDEKYTDLKSNWNEDEFVEAMNTGVLSQKYFCNTISDINIKNIIEENEQIRAIYKNLNGEKEDFKKLNRLLLAALYPDDIQDYQEKVDEIDIIRFPHIANEHSIGKVVDIDEKYRDYYKYATEGIITSIYTFIPLKANNGDYDGDHILTNSSRVLIKAYKEQISNPIIYIPVKRDNVAEARTYKINDMAKTIDTDIKGMSNSIGRVVNQITKLWSMPQESDTSDYIKIMSVIGSLTIDFVKTGEKAAIPKNINTFLKDVKKPDFMRIIYPKQAIKEKRLNKFKRINNQAEISLFGDTDCTMNRVYNYMNQELRGININKPNTEFDYRMLMKNPEPNLAGNKTYPLIVETLQKLKKEYGAIVKDNSMEDDKSENDDESKQEHEYKYRIFNTYARRSLLALCTSKNKMTMDKLLDYIVYAHYCDEAIAKDKDKNIIWNCFGGEFNKRLKNGTDVEFKEVDHAANNKALKNIKGKQIHKLKSDAKTVKIPVFKLNENEQPKEVKIYEGEFKYIKSAIETDKQRRMAFILLAMKKFCEAYKKKFEIYPGKKNSITNSHIERLSNVHDRDFEDIMKKLVEVKFVKLEQMNDSEKHMCSILPEITCEGKAITLTDLNQCRKYFKKLT